MPKLEISPNARRDSAEIVAYIKLDNEIAGEKWLVGFERKVIQLSDHPELGVR